MADVEHTDMEGLWTKFRDKVTAVMKRFIPQKMLRGKKIHKPWVNRKVKALQSKQKKLLVRKKKTKGSKHGKAYKAVKASVQREEKKVYWDYIDNLIEVVDDGSVAPKQKRLWDLITSNRKDNTGVPPLKENGRLFSGTKYKADILGRQYESVYTHEDVTDIPEPAGDSYLPMLDFEVSQEGFKHLLREIKPNNAYGPESIPARILKELADKIAPSPFPPSPTPTPHPRW